MTFKLGSNSLLRLQQVHPDLVKVVHRAIELTKVDFTVLEGARSKERQAELVKAGASQTMNSKHIIQEDGYAHAVDLGALVGGKVRWDWALYYIIADAMKGAAKELKVKIDWGGDWEKFKDGPHFQLSSKDKK